MAMLVIRTQYRENYGTAENPYWKNKGGQEYKVKNLPNPISEEELLDVAHDLLPELQYENEYQIQYMLDWSVESDDYMSWFEKSQLDYDGEITFYEPSYEYDDLKKSEIA